MSHLNDNRLKSRIFSETSSFFLFLVMCVFIGLVIIIAAVFLKQALIDNKEAVFETGQSIGQIEGIGSVAIPLADQVKKLFHGPAELSVAGTDVLRDLGIALLIAAFVTLSIEKYGSDRLRQQITHDVLSAAYAKIIPEKIYTQVRDKVFRSDVYRRKWEVHIRADPQVIDGTAVITSTYSYDIENLNEHEIPFDVVAWIDLDDPPPQHDLPKFESFEVLDEQSTRLHDPNETKLVLNPVPSSPKRMIWGETLKGILSGKKNCNLTLRRDPDAREMTLTAPVRIPGRGRVSVKFQVKREIRVPGHYILSAPVPADGIKILVAVTGFRLDVVALHPDRKALRNRQDSGSWEFDAGILPWQGFRFTSQKEE